MDDDACLATLAKDPKKVPVPTKVNEERCAKLSAHVSMGCTHNFSHAAIQAMQILPVGSFACLLHFIQS